MATDIHETADFVGWIKGTASALGSELVVNGDTGLPGEGLETKKDLHRERENVFNHDWFSIYPPTALEFAEAYENARKNNWKI